MGDIYVEADSLQQAEQCYLYAISVFEKNNRQQLLAASLLSLGRLQFRQHRFTEAIATLGRCVSICQEFTFRQTMLSAKRYLYEAYKKVGNVAQALFYLEQFRNLNDSIFKETTQKQISEFQVRYETAEKELEIERQQSEIARHRARQNMFIGSLAGAGLLLVMLAFIIVLHRKRNRELAEINATKDKFFSIISHDLKNPAVSQRNALKLLVENGGQFDSETLSQYHTELLKSADSHVQLLYNLLNWAQTQTRRMPYQPVSFDLVANQQQTVISHFRDIAKRKGIELVSNLPDQAFVTGDENMLAVVVRNLLDNAIKFTSSGGQVKLSVDPTEKGTFVVSVSDTGMGMNAEQIQNLFRLNCQQSKQGTAGEIGSGLGLIVCKELLEKHGCRLQVESTEGAGCRVWFEV
jgi:signal transduction histidine kinase